MSSDLDLDGPTVTMFGDHDELDQALSDEFGRRGCSTHSVTIPVGWLASASHAVIRLDSRAGERALRDLSTNHGRASTVVAVCARQPDELASRRLTDLCRRCGEHHGVTLIWHPPFDTPSSQVALPAAELATAIADQVGVLEPWTAEPSFATQVVEAHGDVAHS